MLKKKFFPFQVNCTRKRKTKAKDSLKTRKFKVVVQQQTGTQTHTHIAEQNSQHSQSYKYECYLTIMLARSRATNNRVSVFTIKEENPTKRTLFCSKLKTKIQN